MKSFVRLLKRALVSGSYASVVSSLALLHGGVRDSRSAIAPVNAVSHWLWKDKALRQHKATLRYSLTGYVIHHIASIFWATAYEKLAFRHGTAPTKPQALASALTVAGVACAVDMQCTPERLTPGFEHKLSKKSLLVVYVAFGIGLALHTLLDRKTD
ncbi:hypothetical protein CR159_10790 [Pollutimonas subterranea]|uniref:Uncharacterized protein n=1 Tax=Pollutimonas subterranea TaxID=2045210 RepID=A0A2N4U421_9BURK|nr:hypothetical protein [Pollutimonas subterranea]PLC49772.1 hypothetical protein CR159_10790 [Pollutimonas subterranea]